MLAQTMRAEGLAEQLSQFGSSASGSSQPIWSDEDDMKPAKRAKRRERRRSRAPKGFTGTQVAYNSG